MYISSEVKQDTDKKSHFSYPRAFDAPVRKGSLWEYCHTVCTEKLEWCGYPMVKKFQDMFSRFDRILACDRQTDRHLATAQSAVRNTVIVRRGNSMQQHAE